MEDSKKYIFISYKAEERDFVISLRSILKELGVTCWIAVDGIPAGEDYAEVIVDKIRNCSAFILILSDLSQKSKHIIRELELADKYNKKIIPINIDDTGIFNDSFEYRLSDKQILSLKKNVDVIADEIILYLGLVKKKRNLVNDCDVDKNNTNEHLNPCNRVLEAELEQRFFSTVPTLISFLTKELDKISNYVNSNNHLELLRSSELLNKALPEFFDEYYSNFPNGKYMNQIHKLDEVIKKITVVYNKFVDKIYSDNNTNCVNKILEEISEYNNLLKVQIDSIRQTKNT